MTHWEDVARVHQQIWTGRDEKTSHGFNVEALRRGLNATMAFMGKTDSEVGKACQEALRWLDAEGAL